MNVILALGYEDFLGKLIFQKIISRHNITGNERGGLSAEKRGGGRRKARYQRDAIALGDKHLVPISQRRSEMPIKRGTLIR